MFETISDLLKQIALGEDSVLGEAWCQAKVAATKAFNFFESQKSSKPKKS